MIAKLSKLTDFNIKLLEVRHILSVSLALNPDDGSIVCDVNFSH